MDATAESGERGVGEGGGGTNTAGFAGSWDGIQMNGIDIVPNQGVETIGMQHINMKIRVFLKELSLI